MGLGAVSGAFRIAPSWNGGNTRKGNHKFNMPNQKNDMTLPEDFDGVFRFTNASEEAIMCKWNNVAYTFPARSSSPMIISGASPEEVQHIRKKFAREYAIREWYKSGRFKELNAQAPAGSGVTPAVYSDDDLAPYIQQCLEPLQPARAATAVLPKDSAENYRKNPDGTNVTVPLDKDKSLLGNGSGVLTD